MIAPQLGSRARAWAGCDPTATAAAANAIVTAIRYPIRDGVRMLDHRPLRSMSSPRGVPSRALPVDRRSRLARRRCAEPQGDLGVNPYSLGVYARRRLRL